MGNDGGSIPGRKDLVKEKPKEIKIDQEIISKAHASFCAITKQNLSPPIAVCRLGLLYNYEEVIRLFMEKKIPKNFSHLKKLRDLKLLNLTEVNSEKSSNFTIICPMTKIVYNGLNKFKALWSCGCVFSEKLLTEMKLTKNSENNCLICNKPYQDSDLISLNLTIEEQDELKREILENRSKHKNNNNKKEEKVKEKIENGDVIKKKIKREETSAAVPFKNILDNICEKGQPDQKSEIYKSLFHKEYQVEDNLIHRNVRHGIR